MDCFVATLLAMTGWVRRQGGERNFIILVKNPLNLAFAVI